MGWAVEWYTVGARGVARADGYMRGAGCAKVESDEFFGEGEEMGAVSGKLRMSDRTECVPYPGVRRGRGGEEWVGGGIVRGGGMRKRKGVPAEAQRRRGRESGHGEGARPGDMEDTFGFGEEARGRAERRRR